MFNAAIIGLGRMGAEPSVRLEGKIPSGWLPISHAEAIVSTAELTLVAMCDTDPLRVDKISAHYRVEKKYSDYTALLKNEKIDLLSIATRTAGRCEIIKAAIENGVKAIYAEKPISTSLQDAIDTLALVKSKGSAIAYGVNRRYHPAYIKAKELILSGEIGDVVEVVVEAGYAPLLWSHPHSADLMVFFAGTSEIEFIQGSCNNLEWDAKTQVVDSDPMVVNLLVQFSNGVCGTINKTAGLNVRVAGTKGNLTVHADGTFVELYKHTSITPYYFTSRELEEPRVKVSATQFAFAALSDFLNGKPFLAITPEEILASQKILIGVVQSELEYGKRVASALINPNIVITGKSDNFYA